MSPERVVVGSCDPTNRLGRKRLLAIKRGGGNLANIVASSNIILFIDIPDSYKQSLDGPYTALGAKSLTYLFYRSTKEK